MTTFMVGILVIIIYMKWMVNMGTVRCELCDKFFDLDFEEERINPDTGNCWACEVAK